MDCYDCKIYKLNLNVKQNRDDQSLQAGWIGRSGYPNTDAMLNPYGFFHFKADETGLISPTRKVLQGKTCPIDEKLKSDLEFILYNPINTLKKGILKKYRIILQYVTYSPLRPSRFVIVFH